MGKKSKVKINLVDPDLRIKVKVGITDMGISDRE